MTSRYKRISAKAGFLWDFDGVIVYTPHFDAWHLTCELYGISGFNKRFYDLYVSGRPRLLGGKAIIERLGKNLLRGKNAEEIVEKFVEDKNKIFRQLVLKGHYKVNDAAIDFINKARELGILQVLASASKNASFIAKNVILKDGRRLIELFEIDVSGKANSKKAILEIASKILIDLGISKKCIVVFEDSYSGIVSAKEIGLKTVGYIKHVSPEEIDSPDIFIKDFYEVSPLQILREVGCIS